MCAGKQVTLRGTHPRPARELKPRLNIEEGVWSLPSSRGASPWFSGAERSCLTERESPRVIRAAPNVHRQKLEFFERNATVALNIVGTETERRSRGMEFAK